MVKRIQKYIVNFREYMKRGGYEKITKVNELCFNDSNMLHGRTVLITGGDSGIGKRSAEMLCHNGANVIITGRNADKLKKVAEENTNIRYIVWDLRDVTKFGEKMQEAKNMFGNVDILINNAGVYEDDKVKNLAEEQYDRLMDTNLKGWYFLTQEFVKINSGRQENIKKIVNICSVMSFIGETTCYSLSKFAIRGFTEGLAKELADENYIVNGVAPGRTVSPITQNNNVPEDSNLYISGKKRFHRLLVADEVVNVISFLVSDYSNAINGQIIVVDGGETLR